jgi:uncharacterized protein YbaR (Trm112 family)
MSSYPLDLLVCPETHQGLREATPDEVQKLQEQFASSSLLLVSGSPVQQAFDGALVRNDNKVAYLIRSNIPVLLAEEAVHI